MILISHLTLLFFSGLFGIVCNVSFVPLCGVLLTILLFVVHFFWSNLQQDPGVLKLFSIENLDFTLTTAAGNIETLVCFVVCTILFCLHLARKLEKQNEKNLNKVLGLLNILAAFVCLSILSTNLFQFFLGIEASGIVMTVLVGLENMATSNSTKTFFFNKFASLLFFIAISIISAKSRSFDFQSIEEAVSSKQFKLPAMLLLFSCFCKGAQFPFTFWLIDASKANILGTIFWHSTIVTIGIIFINKCYFIFEQFHDARNTMIFVGAITSFLSSCFALFYSNIKKISACLATAAIGLMFVFCGYKEYSLSLLYCICYMVSQSILFLSFFYTTHAMSNEQDIFKMGGIAKLIPNISIIVWLAFLAVAGCPFFVNFAAKASLLNYIHITKPRSTMFFYIATNIVYMTAILRVIIVSFYGQSNADEATISRVPKHNSISTKLAWFLIVFAIFVSFCCYIIYKDGFLHLGHFGNFEYKTFDYSSGIIFETLQISFAMITAILCFKNSNKSSRSVAYAIPSRVLLFVKKQSQKWLFFFLKKIVQTHDRFLKLPSKSFTFESSNIASNLNIQELLCSNHLVWVLFGAIVAAFAVFWR